MATPSPYRSLPAEQRIALVAHVINSSREARVMYAQRLAAKGGGFRAATVQAWPVDRLAREVVRLKAETAMDELDLLQTLYVDREPAIQITMLDAAGVPHENGRMGESLTMPYADEGAVRRAAEAVRAAHGEDGERYLRTLARYGAEGWPGIGAVVAERDA
jgi:hypothetical protein